MKAADRRRLERLFDGRATLADEHGLERDAARDPELAQELARTRALRAACDALPEPPLGQLDVEGLVRRVRSALDAGASGAQAAGDGAAGDGAPGDWAPGDWAPGPRARARAPRLARLAVRALVAAALVSAVTLLVVRGGRRDAPEPTAAVAHGSRLDRAPLAAPDGDGPSSLQPDPAAAPNASSVAATAAAPTELVLPSVPLDTAQRDAALAALAEVLAGEVALAAGAAEPDAGRAAPPALDPARVEALLGARVGAGWPVASLADSLFGDDDPRVAVGAVAYAAARPDALTAGRLGRALERELAASAAPRRDVRLALALALADLGAFDTLARRFDELCAAGDGAALVAAWQTPDTAAHAEGLAAAFARGAWARTGESLAALAALGRPGADVLARVALDGGARSGGAASLDRTAASLSLADEALALLAAAPAGPAAVEDLVRGERYLGGARLARACALVERTAAVGALDWLDAHARRGAAPALRALCRLPGMGPVERVAALDAEGLLRDERAWGELAAADAARLTAYLRAVAAERQGEAERLVGRLIAAGAPEVGGALAAAAATHELGARMRERAALALAALDPLVVGAAASAAIQRELGAALDASLGGSADGVAAGLVVAAAVWVGEDALRAALERHGVPGAERVARAASGAPQESTLARQERVERLLVAVRAVAKDYGRGTRGAELR